MKIPSETDWRSEPWDLDIPYAYEHFCGKSVDESVPMFEENALCYQEDIMFMPVPCFRYYVLAYTKYLLSESSRDDSDGASCFFGIVEMRKDDILASSKLVKGEIIRTLQRLKDYQEWYDASEDIYGSFRQKTSECLELLEAEQ